MGLQHKAVVPKISTPSGYVPSNGRHLTHSMQEELMAEDPPVHAFFRSLVLYHIEY
jgi:hypothetical protein